MSGKNKWTYCNLLQIALIAAVGAMAFVGLDLGVGGWQNEHSLVLHGFTMGHFVLRTDAVVIRSCIGDDWSAPPMYCEPRLLRVPHDIGQYGEVFYKELRGGITQHVYRIEFALWAR